MLPLIYSIALDNVAGLPLDRRQQAELFLAAAQTLCAEVFLLDLRLHWYGALILFGLFVAQFVWLDHVLTFAAIYLVVGLIARLYHRRGIRMVLHDVRVALWEMR